MAGPLVIAQLLYVGMGFIDLVMIGRLGAEELAAGGIGATLWSFIAVSTLGLLMAVSPITAQLKGADEDKKIGSVFRQGLWLGVVVGLIFFVVARKMSLILDDFDIEATVILLSDEYLKAVSWGMPAASLYYVGRFSSEGVGHTRPIMMIQIVALVINIFLNYILIYGKFGAPRLGVEGAGWATSMVLYLNVLMMFLYLKMNRVYKDYELFTRIERPCAQEILNILKLSVPIAIAFIMEIGLFGTIALLMGRFGTDAVAAHQLAINYAAMMYMVPLGISMAVTIRIGHAVGEKKYRMARFRAWLGTGLALGFASLSALFMLLFPEAIIGMYTHDQSVKFIAVQLIFMAALFQLSDGLQAMAAASLRGLKDTTIPMFAIAIAYWLIGFPIAWYVGITLAQGPVGLWVGLIGGLSFAALLLNFRFYRLSLRYILLNNDGEKPQGC